MNVGWLLNCRFLLLNAFPSLIRFSSLQIILGFILYHRIMVLLPEQQNEKKRLIFHR